MLFGVQWYYWLILAVAVILTIFAWTKAMSASRARRERLKKEAAIWKRDYDLRQTYSVLTEDKIKEAEEAELLHGVAMNIQVMLEKQTNMAEAFNDMPEEKKFIYALEYFDEDAKTSLSTFFKNNGAPLVPVIPEALKAIGAEKYLPFIEMVYSMYDEDSEVSIDYDVIEKADVKFNECYDSAELCRLCAKYIINNKNTFLN
ncbi:MAG: hypothetical protein IKV44_06515 [Clostridia bacterium]|nr:hypothetical protein [Clostridia bacterium]